MPGIGLSDYCLLGYGPIMPVNQRDPSVFINRGGRLPAPMQSLKN